MRLFARTPLRVARRRLLGAAAGAAPAATAPLDPRTLWPARNASADRPGPDGFLPLPPAFEEGARQAQALGLDREEHLRPGGGGTDSVQAAVAGGTLGECRDGGWGLGAGQEIGGLGWQPASSSPSLSPPAGTHRRVPVRRECRAQRRQ